MNAEDKKKGGEARRSQSAGKKNKGQSVDDKSNKAKQPKMKIKGAKTGGSIASKQIASAEEYLKRAGFKDGQQRVGKELALKRMLEVTKEKEKKAKERSKSKANSKKQGSKQKDKKPTGEKDVKVHNAKRDSSKPKKPAK